MMRYELAIFDLDGTLLDTLEDLTDSMNHALEKYGYPSRTIDEVRSFVGNGLMMLVRRAIAPERDEAMIQTVFTELKSYYKEHCADKTKPYDGMIELLEKLKMEGCRLAVVSNKADYAVQILCEQYFPGLFDMTVGEKENVRKKPAPDSVNAVLRELQTEREKAVYIGDSEVDIETAKNAGLDAILVSWGFRDAYFLRQNGAGCIADNIEMLEKAFLIDKERL